MTDPITGATWGAVTRNGGEVVGSYDDTKNLGVYAKFAYGYYMGTNVATNQSYEFTSGAYFRPYKDETSELKLGISGTYLAFNQNFNNYTLGQGGYFSPQTFYSLTFPIDWNETVGKFKYNAGGAIGPLIATSFILTTAGRLGLLPEQLPAPERRQHPGVGQQHVGQHHQQRISLLRGDLEHRHRLRHAPGLRIRRHRPDVDRRQGNIRQRLPVRSRNYSTVPARRY